MSSVFDFPKVSVVLSSLGRLELMKGNIDSWVKLCSYPNYEIVIVHSKMTDVSKSFMDIAQIQEVETEKYLLNIQNMYPRIRFKVIIQDFKPYGKVLQQLVDESCEYFINIADDWETICDPKDQIVEAITLLRNDEKLLGVCLSLRMWDWPGDCPYDAVTISGNTYLVDRNNSGDGMQLMSKSRVLSIGGFFGCHHPESYAIPEQTQSREMVSAGMYVGYSTKFFGCMRHVGMYSVLGGDREVYRAINDDLVKYGRFGTGENMVKLPHGRDWYMTNFLKNE